MNNTALVLQERREAEDMATREFERVKRQKLDQERSRCTSTHPFAKDDKQLERERCNRASAAASRAKIMCYSKELERRTDRLEAERNSYRESAHRASKNLRSLHEEARLMKKALWDIWGMKDPNITSYLLNSDVLILLRSRHEESDVISGDSNIESGDAEQYSTPGRIADLKRKSTSDHTPLPLHLPPPMSSPNSDSTRLERPALLPALDADFPSTPRKTASTLRNLIHPSNINPNTRASVFSPCISPNDAL